MNFKLYVVNGTHEFRLNKQLITLTVTTLSGFHHTIGRSVNEFVTCFESQSLAYIGKPAHAKMFYIRWAKKLYKSYDF